MSLLFASAVEAGTSEVREVARINGCPPKKIEVFSQAVGVNGQVVYRVDCNLPKPKGGGDSKGANAMFIGCAGLMCEMVRPVSDTSK